LPNGHLLKLAAVRGVIEMAVWIRARRPAAADGEL
jgi:hypothetical protein